MKLLIFLVCLLSGVLAEPPVGGGYPAGRSQDHDQDYSSQIFGSSRNSIKEYSPPNARNSISSEYGAPNARTSSISSEYGAPNARTLISSEYGAPNTRTSRISSEYDAPNARSSSISSEYGAPNARTSSISSEYDAPNARTSRISSEYDAPNARSSSISSEYGATNARTSSISSEYGAPNVRSSSISSEYGAPNARSSSISSEYGPPNARTASPRQKYAPPAARVSFSQTYGLPKNRGLVKSIPQEYQVPNERNAPSQDYKNPNTRSGLSLEYGVPETRSGISEEYGIPVQHSLSQEYESPELSSRSLSTEYGVPDVRSSPSDEYGAPAVARSGIKPSSKTSGSSSKSSFRSFQARHTNDYAVPSARSNELSQSFGQKPSKGLFGARRSSAFSASKTPYSSAPAGSLSSSYGVPSAKDFNSYSQGYNAPSESYGLPAVTYETPSEMGLSGEYGMPSSPTSLKTKAIASSYSSARSSSSSYVPPSRVVSEQYGLPEQYDALSNQGYNYAAGALDESNQDPANYDFSYKVNDSESGSDFGHTESRQENHAEGSYFVVLPDGTKQIVEYEADEEGFKPRISVEPAAHSGYDENASDLARSDGPY